jgi:hypothetical protein
MESETLTGGAEKNSERTMQETSLNEVENMSGPKSSKSGTERNVNEMSNGKENCLINLKTVSFPVFKDAQLESRSENKERAGS